MEQNPPPTQPHEELTRSDNDWKKSLDAMEAEDRNWVFLPIILGAATTCLLIFLLLSGIDSDQSVGAKNARPGAETAATKP